MIRRVLACAALALVLAAPASAATSWAQPQIKVVTARGLMGGKAAGFRPDDPLTAGELGDLVAGLTGKQQAPVRQPGACRSRSPSSTPSSSEDSACSPSPASSQQRSGRPGWCRRARFGTETVARLLGLRVNHPAAQDDLELGPESVATRAEAAFSAARILGLHDRRRSTRSPTWPRPSAPTPLAGLQRSVLQTAVSFVGYPYVWGGTSELPQDPFGTGTAGPGRLRLLGLRLARLQAPGLRRRRPRCRTSSSGRTTYAMSGEVPLAQADPAGAGSSPATSSSSARPAPRSKPAQINHMGIYLGGGWFIQSSDQGVALAPLTSDWYGQRFAWGRRPLAEAGLG